MKSQGVEEFYDFFFFLFFLFSSACHAGMLEAFVGEGPLSGGLIGYQTHVMGIVNGNMDKSTKKDDEWCLDQLDCERNGRDYRVGLLMIPLSYFTNDSPCT